MPKHVTSILNALRPLCLYNGILGLTIFEMPIGIPWPKLSILYAVVRSIIYVYFFWQFRRMSHINYFAIETMITTIRIIHLSNIFIAVVSTILGFKNYKEVKTFAKKITLADETLEIFGIDPEYKATFDLCMQAIFIWCFGSCVILSSDLAIAYYYFDDFYDMLVRVLLFQFPLILNLTNELNFYLIIYILGTRFERLNSVVQSATSSALQPDDLKNHNKYQNTMKKYINKVTVQPVHYNKNRNNIEFVLRIVRQLHLDLCAMSREVNDTFSKQLSLQMAATFLLLTGFGYCTYVVYIDVNYSLAKKIHHFYTLGIWIAMSIFRIMCVIRVTVNVSEESQKTSQLAHEIQVSRWQKKITDEIHQISLQIMQHPLYFTASGLIVLDFGFVRGFVGSVTTYLMILIQNEPDMVKAANALVEVSSDNETSSKS
ncbi:putative gustatory receptor 28a [Copidosoma floridanum]|uniref:putative gustatory receptor 28a n=1 Tax=Copidosoma floridanum TaxID=29053 RepID=UPI000C6F5A1A|nr:putative gustatory receptor 28a [Copidosoma floridanum]